ncbi:MAG: GatB/YqeY domain-containing protein [Candidatus Hydrogenedentales bacterium]
MSIRDNIQKAITEATKSRDRDRLECLRMAKGALLLREKEGPKEQGLTDAEAVATLRAEVKKRQQSIEVFQQANRPDAAEKVAQEIVIIEEFLPQQLDEAALESRVRAYAAANPEIDHPGKLTGAMKKELGDLADGRMLNDVCRRVLDATP